MSFPTEIGSNCSLALYQGSAGSQVRKQSRAGFGCILTLSLIGGGFCAIETDDRKVARTRRQECLRYRYVAQAFPPAGSGNFPVPCRGQRQVALVEIGPSCPELPDVLTHGRMKFGDTAE